MTLLDAGFARPVQRQDQVRIGEMRLSDGQLCGGFLEVLAEEKAGSGLSRYDAGGQQRP